MTLKERFAKLHQKRIIDHVHRITRKMCRKCNFNGGPGSITVVTVMVPHDKCMPYGVSEKEMQKILKRQLKEEKRQNRRRV